MRRIWGSLKAALPVSIASIVSMAGVLGIYVYKLATLVHGASRQEVANVAKAQNYVFILKHPINLPYFGTLFVVRFLGAHSVFWLRLVNVSIAFLICLGLYLLLRHWVSGLSAVLGSFLFAISAWGLHTGRLSTETIVSGLIVLGIWLAVWFQHTKLRKLVFLFGSLTVSVLLFIPGINIIVLLGLIWQRKTILGELKHIPIAYIIFCIIVSISIVVPLILATTNDPSYLLRLAGVPAPLPTLSGFAHSCLQTLGNLFYKSQLPADMWLGTLPILNLPAIVLLAAGIYGCIINWALDRSKFLLVALPVLILLTSFSGILVLYSLVIVCYLLCAVGIEVLIGQWRSVFPKNPFANKLGSTLISLVVIGSCLFALTQYFVAWPHATATKQAFGITKKL